MSSGGIIKAMMPPMERPVRNTVGSEAGSGLTDRRARQLDVPGEGIVLGRERRAVSVTGSVQGRHRVPVPGGRVDQ
ncbi:hypothetical protein [Streptomyces sp. NPDC102360]|uniref:hypothetical protein n=1 Tax=Streptomyces sp. NPDC102360 TaxID=3366160 RepID=UPI0037F65D44